ncbi:YdbL family protein [Parvibaculum sp.]|uniref:YdbL family protein n=1 Tax=Parvibaculum sp. TaxID=2024848 RepID=UPI001AFDCE57|nr:YdbL family protein [Parvibaculum sp.]MBO6667787.1 YdbL family protein [Parvibaculum sp.]MBO6690650.1 YdbL family protein [Parvibaculum sp.]MBO6714977.1 YdbL family protein [Parvibaculum sp.]
MRTIMKSALPLFALLFSLVVAGPALAIDLDSAKAQGLVGEKLDGYVGIVTSSPSPDLTKMVNDINLRRRDSYRAIADKTAGATLNAVEKLAAEKLIRKTPSGQYVEKSPGQWVKKP